MKAGSIVARTVPLGTAEAEAYLIQGRLVPPMHEPCVLKEDPFITKWGKGSIPGQEGAMQKGGVVTVIILEEYPEYEYNIGYFTELQPPQSISIEEIIGSMVPAMVCAAM